MTLTARDILATLETRRVISLVGGGGKTTLMFRLGRELARRGKRVITTTTTHIAEDEAREAGPLIVTHSAGGHLMDRLCRKLDSHGQVSLAQKRLKAQGKLLGLGREPIEAIRAARICDHLIVEADGAARRPLKAPAAHEPLLPISTDLLIGVAGLAGVGKPLTPRWVHRPEHFGRLSGLAPGGIIGAREVTRVITHDQGLLKNLPPGAESWVFLNQADLPGARAAGREIAEIMQRGMPRRPQLLIIGAAARNVWIETVYLWRGSKTEMKDEAHP